jgi:pseudaminic acid cytidylyltransferase
MPTTVCIIPARGGSQRIPRKNIKPFAGKPMLEHAIQKARAARLFDKVYVSTDDEEIASCAERCQALVHYRTPDDGNRGTQEIAADVLRWLGEPSPALACVLYPCTPLLTIEELIFGWRLLLAPIQGSPLFVHSASDDKGTDAGGYYWGYSFAFIQEIALQACRIGVPVQHHRDINTPEDWDATEKRYLALAGQAGAGRPS